MATQQVSASVAATLCAAEVERFRRDGYLGPYSLCSPDEMAALRPSIERVLETDPPVSHNRLHNRHLDSRAVYDLATHPAIIGRMVALYGPDLLLWRTNFFVKNRGSKAIPWHQDFHYWPLEPPVIISAWIAVDPSTRQNGNLQVIPGSHRTIVPHVEATPDMQFKVMADAGYYDPGDLTDLEMQPGAFILFNSTNAPCTTRRPTTPTCAASGWRCGRSSPSSKSWRTTPRTIPCRSSTAPTPWASIASRRRRARKRLRFGVTSICSTGTSRRLAVRRCRNVAVGRFRLQLRAYRCNDSAGDVHRRRCLDPGVYIGGYAARQTVRVPGGHVILVEDRQTLAEPRHDLQRGRELYQRVTENGSLTASIAKRFDRFLADLLALKAHLREEPLAQSKLGVGEVTLSLLEPPIGFSAAFPQFGILFGRRV